MLRGEGKMIEEKVSEWLTRAAGFGHAHARQHADSPALPCLSSALLYCAARATMQADDFGKRVDGTSDDIQKRIDEQREANAQRDTQMQVRASGRQCDSESIAVHMAWEQGPSRVCSSVRPVSALRA